MGGRTDYRFSCLPGGHILQESLQLIAIFPARHSSYPIASTGMPPPPPPPPPRPQACPTCCEFMHTAANICTLSLRPITEFLPWRAQSHQGQVLRYTIQRLLPVFLGSGENQIFLGCFGRAAQPGTFTDSCIPEPTLRALPSKCLDLSSPLAATSPSFDWARNKCSYAPLSATDGRFQFRREI